MPDLTSDAPAQEDARPPTSGFPDVRLPLPDRSQPRTRRRVGAGSAPVIPPGLIPPHPVHPGRSR